MVGDPLFFFFLLFSLCQILLPQKVELKEKWKGQDFLKYIYVKRMHLWKWGNWIDLVTWIFKILDEYSSSSLPRTLEEGNKFSCFSNS